MSSDGMRAVLPILLLLVVDRAASDQLVYRGTWNTTNRKLDGTMTCIVTPLADDEWQGRFYGTWQGVAFDYTVRFTGSADDLHGTATIDGAAYRWKGRISPGRFKGSFGGDRYAGTFDLKRKQDSTP